MVEHDLGTHIDTQLLRTLIDFGILETGQEPGERAEITSSRPQGR
jgi:hypothetical protein